MTKKIPRSKSIERGIFRSTAGRLFTGDLNAESAAVGRSARRLFWKHPDVFSEFLF